MSLTGDNCLHDSTQFTVLTGAEAAIYKRGLPTQDKGIYVPIQMR